VFSQEFSEKFDLFKAKLDLNITGQVINGRLCWKTAIADQGGEIDGPRRPVPFPFCELVSTFAVESAAQRLYDHSGEEWNLDRNGVI